MNIRHDKVIKVGYLVSYDWRLLANSLPLVYDHSDIIMLALDEKCRTWAGNRFDFDRQAFEHLITSIDRNNKIHIYEDNFYDPSLSTMANEVRERNMLAEKLQIGGWHIQIDADEYPINFPDFVNQLRKIDPNPSGKLSKPVNVSANIITIIKKLSDGFIYVIPDRNNYEQCILATQQPRYEYGRKNGYFNLQTNAIVIHESISRSEEDFYFKLKNWGHNQDFNIDSYFALWKSIDNHNYSFIKNFHPIEKSTWPALGFSPAKDINELIEYFRNSPLTPPNDAYLIMKNSRMLARIKALVKRLNWSA